MPGISRWLTAIKALLGFSTDDHSYWSQRAVIAAANPSALCVSKWAEEARSRNIDEYFHDLMTHQTHFELEKQRLLRRLMTQGRPILPGSPRAWQWPVDEDSERECWMVLLNDALDGSVFESGAPQFSVQRGPRHLSGTELKDIFLRESDLHKDALIWKVQPSLSGYHSWSLYPISAVPRSPLLSIQPPSLSSSVMTVSQFGPEDETHSSTLPGTPSHTGFPFDVAAVAAAERMICQDGDTIRAPHPLSIENHGSRPLDLDSKRLKFKRGLSGKDATRRPKRPQLRPVEEALGVTTDDEDRRVSGSKRPASRSPSRSSIASVDPSRPTRSRTRARTVPLGGEGESEHSKASDGSTLPPSVELPELGTDPAQLSTLALSQIPRFSNLRHYASTNSMTRRSSLDGTQGVTANQHGRSQSNSQIPTVASIVASGEKAQSSCSSSQPQKPMTGRIQSTQQQKRASSRGRGTGRTTPQHQQAPQRPALAPHTGQRSTSRDLSSKFRQPTKEVDIQLKLRQWSFGTSQLINVPTPKPPPTTLMRRGSGQSVGGGHGSGKSFSRTNHTPISGVVDVGVVSRRVSRPSSRASSRLAIGDGRS